MNKKSLKRRSFLKTTATAGLASFAAPVLASETSGQTSKLAVQGGKPVRTDGFLSWPQIDKSYDKVWMDVLHDRGWCRLNGDKVKTFEADYAKLMGVKDCIATNSGTSALFGSLNGLGIGPGDEVLVPPYTFVATVNVVFLQHALPVFVDTDPETFQMDASKIEEKITDKTRAIIPVHLGGNMCDMDKIMSIAKKHNLHVIEDACQAHMGEWQGKKSGSVGDVGCFSFQVTKNLSSGDGGAIIGNNMKLMDRIFSFQSNGRERTKNYGFQYINNGANLRMTEFQGVLLLKQLGRLDELAKTREDNADYLSKQLNEIPGITPAKMYKGCTRNAYHLYMMRYDKEKFGGASRGKFIEAIRAEGIPCASGYTPLNKEPLIDKTLRSEPFGKVFSKKTIDKYMKENQCPANDRLCKEEALWFFQNMMLGSRNDMDQIAEAVRKVHKNVKSLV
jgi:perosamine synthetase